jgi:hypothetical protein
VEPPKVSEANNATTFLEDREMINQSITEERKEYHQNIDQFLDKSNLMDNFN